MMGNKYRRLYMESVMDKAPMFWAAPPANIFAADISETVVSSILSGVGGFVLSGGIAYLSSGNTNAAQSLAWAGIAFGTVLVAPIAGEMLSGILGDVTEAIAQGWYRGHPVVETEPEQPTRDFGPTEDELGSARLPGHWWYKSRDGQSHCYQTPTDKNRRVIISDQRMQAIFNLVLHNTPFSELEITGKVSGLSGPRFRMLQQDWRTRELYRLHDDKTGNLTELGARIARAIVATPLPIKNG